MKRQKGMSLLEVLISLVLLAMIIAPFLNMFLQSTKTRMMAQEILYANYAAINQMEKLAAMNCRDLCFGDEDIGEEDFFIKTHIITWGAREQPYFYLIFQRQGESGKDAMLIPPGGSRGIFIDNLEEFVDVEIVVEGDSYWMEAGSHRISGSLPTGNIPVVLINAARKPKETSIDIRIGGSVDVIVYPDEEGGLNLDYDGTPIVNEGIYYRDYTLFRARVEVFSQREGDKSLVKMESILRVPN